MQRQRLYKSIRPAGESNSGYLASLGSAAGIGAALLAAVFFSLPSAALSARELDVQNARIDWVPGMLPNRAFFTLVNSAERAVTLTGARSPKFARVEFKAPPDNDLFILESLQMPQTVQPGDVLEFQPGGPYLFLHVKSGYLEPGTVAEIELLFQDHPSLTVDFPVRKAH